MKKTTICLAVLLSLFLSFNAYAMKNYEHGWPDIAIPSPSKDSDFQYGYRWTWLDDDLCIQFQANEVKTAKITREFLRGKHDAGLTTCWYDENEPKKRDAYSGKWSQSEDGIWSFQFDDYTIPVDITKIDGVLYAFNGYGELVEGYDYWNGHKTAADGLVTCTDPEFITYLETQYIPDCTSHE